MNLSIYAKNFLETFILFLPAMVANGTPVVVGRLIKNSHPIDFGFRFFDENPLLGPGKTWEGFFGGLVVGAIFGLLAHFLLPQYSLILTSFYVPLGALLGDIFGSFLKRRLGLRRGEPLPLLDQLDFYLGVLIVLILCNKVPDIVSLILMAITIYFLHRATNFAAYKLGLKSVPW